MGLFDKVIDYLEGNGIKVVGYSEGKSDLIFPERAYIDIEKQDKFHWEYFNDRLNRDKAIVNLIDSGETIRFEFKQLNEAGRKFLGNDVEIFLGALKRKFYEVNPKVRKFSVLIKPTHRCNMDCKYCYDKPFRDRIKSDMSMETLDTFLKLASQYTQELEIIWHGGESTMVGKDWFIEAHEKIIPKYPMLDYKFGIMSNGVNIDDGWIELFKKYNIDLGISYNAMHQQNLRVVSQKNDTLEVDLKRGDHIENLLVKTNCSNSCFKIGVIDVITNVNYKDQIEIYEFYKNINTHVSMNRVFHTKNTDKNKLDLDADDFIKEFKKYFRYWMFDVNGQHERSAIEAVALVFSYNGRTCSMTDCRHKWLGINPLGDIYPCDRYYPDRYLVGNVKDFNSIEEMFISEGYMNYYKDVQKRFDNYCSKCEIYEECLGGCNANYIELFGTADKQNEGFCYITKELFKFIYEIMRGVDPVTDTNINPALRMYLLESGVYTVKEIYDFLNKYEIKLDLQYVSQDIVNCSEYKLFRFINRIEKSRTEHVDFMFANEDEIAEKYNLDVREKKLKERVFNYFKDLLDDLDLGVEYIDELIEKKEGRLHEC